ncbi:MAG: sugar transferase, partial [Thermoguttaceae bacterium]
MPKKCCQKTLKRTLDLLTAAALLILLSPILALVALAIQLILGAPVLFSHRRPGKGCKPFTVYKFRTMTDNRDSQGNLLPDALRLTALGKFLRKTSLDEFPQLYNVLRGEMSLVGPRPLCMEYLPYFTEREQLRHTVRPGITGWGQIHGRNQVSWDDRLAFDVWYVENWSFFLDLKILALTAV